MRCDAAGHAAPPSVSVRHLCAFTACHGDLDRHFTPAATALEGLRSQQLLSAGRGPDYETEIALQAVIGGLRVRGRADGFDARSGRLEEIKAHRGAPEDLPANRRHLHWAQLQCYGALFCQARGLPHVTLGLVYVDVATQTETVLQEVCDAAALLDLLTQRCAAYLGWAQQEAAHRLQRDAALQALPFPRPPFRQGQRELAAAVYRACVGGRALLAQAPTGIGKTLGTLFPALRALAAARLDKLAFLTCKGTGRGAAEEALAELRAALPGQPLRVLSLVPKDQGCLYPDRACHGQACPLARGFHDRLPAARAQAVAQGWLDTAAQRRIALQHGLCPYHFGHELWRWADVLVGDVHHLLDAQGQLWGLQQALEWRLVVLIDEAHNLVARAQRLYSAEMRVQRLRAAARLAPPPIREALQRLTDSLLALVDPGADYTVLDTLPDPLAQDLQTASSRLAEHFRLQPLATGPLLLLHFELQRFARLADPPGDHALLDLQTVAAAPDRTATAEDSGASAAPAPQTDEGTDTVLSLRNVLPAPHLRARWRALQGLTLFSATLTPPEHALRLLGLPADTGWVDVPPAFDPANLVVRVADGLSTRWADRPGSLQPLVRRMAAQFDAHPGNYLAFFSSFDYLERAAAALALLRPDITQWRQDRAMPAAARNAFLERFVPGGQGIGFAVLGGVFAEGVDLPGSRLIGAFIATLGLPPVSPVQDAIQTRLDQLFGPDHGHADRIPALHKVVQAAGRILRTPQDRGWLWLLDERYRRADIAALLPTWWQVRGRDEP